MASQGSGEIGETVCRRTYSFAVSCYALGTHLLLRHERLPFLGGCINKIEYQWTCAGGDS